MSEKIAGASANAQQALEGYYKSVRGPRRQGFKRRFWMVAAPAIAATVLLPATFNSIAGSGTSEAESFGGDDKQYTTGANEGVTTEAPLVIETTEAAKNISCSLASVTPLEFSGSGVRTVIAELNVTGVGLSDSGNTVHAPLVHDGEIVPASGGNARIVEEAVHIQLPGDSTAKDVYGIYFSAAGETTVCGGFALEGPEGDTLITVSSAVLPERP